MTLIRWSPVRRSSADLANVHDDVSHLIESVFDRPFWNGSRELPFRAPVDIEETKEAFILRLDVPGVTQKDVKVSLLGDTLTVRGERRLDRSTPDATVLRTERVAGTFERTFQLGRRVRADQVRASVRDGVLEIEVPKADEAKPRDIEVQLG